MQPDRPLRPAHSTMLCYSIKNDNKYTYLDPKDCSVGLSTCCAGLKSLPSIPTSHTIRREKTTLKNCPPTSTSALWCTQDPHPQTSETGAREMVQWVEVLAPKPDSLALTTRIQKVSRRIEITLMAVYKFPTKCMYIIKKQTNKNRVQSHM